jgi:hypothetical protein
MAAIIVLHSSARITGFHLISLLEMTRYSLCADPHDRIYALLSLLTKKERQLWAIVPDCAKSTRSLFHDLCCIFQNTKVHVQRHGRSLGEMEEWLYDILVLDDPVQSHA